MNSLVMPRGGAPIKTNLLVFLKDAGDDPAFLKPFKCGGHLVPIRTRRHTTISRITLMQTTVSSLPPWRSPSPILSVSTHD